ncbi:MAG: hypothetical protein ACK5LZ_06780 [Anaerorhabdus sp.]
MRHKSEGGVNPDAFGDSDSDIAKAQAGTGLFEKTTENTEVSMKIDDLFLNQYTDEIFNESADEQLFTQSTELKPVYETRQEVETDGYFLLISIIVVIVMGYVYYLIQKRKMVDEVVNAHKGVFSEE